MYRMAELNQFQRSKDRLTEILYFLRDKNGADEQTNSYIMIIENAIRTIDHKIQEFKLHRLEVGV